MDEFYNKNDETNNYNDIGINLVEEPPVVIDREFVCPVRLNSEKLQLYIVQMRLDTEGQINELLHMIVLIDTNIKKSSNNQLDFFNVTFLAPQSKESMLLEADKVFK